MTSLVYGEDVLDGYAGYAPGAELLRAIDAGRAERWWRLGNRIVSLKLKKSLGGGMWKNRDRFQLQNPEDDLSRLEAAGVSHPSSWGDCYHKLAPHVAPLKWTLNGLFAWWPGGPWSEARRKGSHAGTWYRYDLQGAYRWAATWGLPDPTTYRVMTRRRDVDGLWIVDAREDRPDLPTIFQTKGMRVVISSEEIEKYNFSCDVVRGVTWSRTLPADYIENTLRRLPFPKDIGRAYWGRWIARDPLVCGTPAREWELKNIAAHFIWGWIIVGRVRWRVWEVAQEAAHVYVDEVLIPHPLEEGGEGSWKLKQTYPAGVTVHRTGWYGDSTTTTMQTGVARNAPTQ